MESEQRIQALEQEVQILKNQIQSILLDIQTHLLTNAYPALRGHHTSGSTSVEDADEDDDEYDRVAPAPKVHKVTSKSNGAEPKRKKASAKTAEPMMASLDEQQAWVLQNIQSVGPNRTRELIDEYMSQGRITPEVADTLMRFTDIYEAAADEPTLPARPDGMLNTVKVKAVTAAPTRKPDYQQPQQAAPKPAAKPAAPKRRPVEPAPHEPSHVDQSFTPDVYLEPQEPHYEQAAFDEYNNAEAADQAQPSNGQETEASSLVLRLIAGVQNAGAGVRWGKTKS